MRQLSPDGFAERFKACSRALWCIAAAILGDTNQAEDVLQEAALIALRKLNEFDPETAFSAWMGQIVRFVALNHARRRRSSDRAAPVEPLQIQETAAGRRTAEPVPVNGSGHLEPDQRAFDDRVVTALRGLDDTARACLLLRVVMEMPYREIAVALDIPQGTAMSHVHRARKVMSERLQTAAPVAGGPSDD